MNVREWMPYQGTPRTYTYFVQGVDGGPIKIGTSDEPAERLKQLQAASPVRLVILGVSVRVSEREAHSRFNKHRIKRTEWFHPAPELVMFATHLCEPIPVPVRWVDTYEWAVRDGIACPCSKCRRAFRKSSQRGELWRSVRKNRQIAAKAHRERQA
jgi:hypothetical protein